MLIPKDIFPIVKSTAREHTRYALAAVHLQRLPTTDKTGRCQATVTDGRAIIRTTWSETDGYPLNLADTEPIKGFTACIESADWIALGKATPKYLAGQPFRHYAVVEESSLVLPTVRKDGTVTEAGSVTMVTGLDHGYKCIPAALRFPGCNDIIPDYDILPRPKDNDAGALREAVQITLGAKLFSKTLRTIAGILGDNPVTLVVPRCPMKPITLKGRTDSPHPIYVLAVLMPVHSTLAVQ